MPAFPAEKEASGAALAGLETGEWLARSCMPVERNSIKNARNATPEFFAKVLRSTKKN